MNSTQPRVTHVIHGSDGGMVDFLHFILVVLRRLFDLLRDLDLDSDSKLVGIEAERVLATSPGRREPPQVER